MQRLRRFPTILSTNSKDCGLAALASVLNHYGAKVSLEALRPYLPVDAQGTSLAAIESTARHFGLEATAGTAKPDALTFMPLPAIAHLNTSNGGHFVTVYRVTNKHVHCIDPNIGAVRLRRADFEGTWSRSVLLVGGKISSNAAVLIRPPSSTRIKSLFEPDIAAIGWIFLLTALAGAAAAAVSWVLGHLINGLVEHSSFGYGISLIFLTGILLVRLAANFYSRSGSTRVGSKVELRLGSRYISALLQAPLIALEGFSVGDYLSRLTDITRVRRVVLGSAVALFVDGLLLSLVCIWLLRVTLWAGIGVTTVLCLVYGVVITAGRRLSTIYLSTRQHMSAFQAEFVEKMGNLRVIKSLTAESVVSVGLQNSLQKALLGVESAENGALLMDIMLQSISAACNVLVLLVGIHQVSTGHLTPGGLVLVITLSNLFMGSIERAAPTIAAVQEAGVSATSIADTIEQLLKTDNSVVNSEPERVPPIPAGIVLDKVSFKYTNSLPVVTDLSLRLEPGENICIIGETGSGKSTLACLLTGLFQPTEGRIFPIVSESNDPPESLRTLASIVFQEAGLWLVLLG